jgi:class 3 adenylate cyclase
VQVCGRCGHESPDGARFCAECGAQLQGDVSREERKVVTAVFVDLVGSTARAERLDPEDVRALLHRYHEALRGDLERYGGTVEKFIGDAVVAVFGAPVAHEDDPERAVRAALAARESIGALNDADAELDLHLRIGIATGEALVALGALPAAGEGMVAGDVMNTAARIQAAAPIDGILVGAATYRATERSIVYRPHAPVVAKGKADPVEVWEAVEALARVAGLEQEGRAPLVGRDHERALLLGTFARVRVERAPQLVTLVGVPGIGKSRLVAELGAAVADDEELIYWRYGRCLPYGEGVTYWALGEVVKAQAGILENDSADIAGQKLAQAIADAAPEGERRWTESFVRPLVGLGAAETALRDRREEAYAAWRTFLEGIAERRPLVVVLDDLQWADDGLLDFVDELPDLVVGVPLLVVCCARPELLDRRPGWGGGKRNALTVTLAPLSREDTERLVESLLGRDPADEGLRHAVVERAAGNPLYAEEFVRMQGTSAGAGGLPDTVLGIVSARVDLLAADEKELLRDAAVVGTTVWSDSLQAVAERDEGEVAELLRSLERKEFLRRERRSAVAGATQHAFVHALVRDAVYAQLPRADRVARHLRVAEWIESLPADRREDRAEMLAHHYQEAIELAALAGIDVAEVRPRAAAALREAGARALRLGAFPAAVRTLRSAAGLMEGVPDPEHLRDLGLALVFAEGSGESELKQAFDGYLAAGNRLGAAVVAGELANARWQRGEGTGEWIVRSLGLLEGAEPSPQRARVLAQAARFRMLAGAANEAVTLADEAIAIALETSADVERAQALITRVTARANLGTLEGFREAIDEAIVLALERDFTEVTRAYNNLGSIYADTGDLEAAVAATRAGVAEVERLGTGGGAGGFVRGSLAELLFLVGGWDEADRIAAEEILRAGRTGGLYQESMFMKIRAEIALARTGVDESTSAAAAGLEHARGTGDVQAVLPALAYAARVFARAGREVEAATHLDELLAFRRGNPGGVMAGEWAMLTALALWRLGRGGDLAQLGSSPTTRWLDAALLVESGRLETAADMLRAIGALPHEAEVRVLAASELLESDEAAASAQIDRAREIYRRLDARARLRDLDGLVAAGG